MTCLTFLHIAPKIGSDDATQHDFYDTDFDDDRLVFLVSSVAACLALTTQLLNLSNQKSTASLTVKSSLADAFGYKSCIVVLALGCYWLDTILKEIILIFSTPASASRRDCGALLRLNGVVLQIVLPVTKGVLSRLTQSSESSLSSDVCIRSCLSLIRNAAFLSQRRVASVNAVNIDVPSPKHTFQGLSYSPSIDSGLDDALLMSIDIDSLIRNRQSSENNSSGIDGNGLIREQVSFPFASDSLPFDDSNVCEMWKFLLYCLVQSKVRGCTGLTKIQSVVRHSNVLLLAFILAFC